jgi:hypothetical protein
MESRYQSRPPRIPLYPISNFKQTGEIKMVRSKFQLTEITEMQWGGKRLKFQTIYDNSIPEDARFQKATPSGSIEMVIDNPVALAQFELGKYYYADFSAIEPAQFRAQPGSSFQG